tara:strand:+ start:92 stop:610 length:519 start_codon:yes stop_codon:yes gene_type:complete
MNESEDMGGHLVDEALKLGGMVAGAGECKVPIPGWDYSEFRFKNTDNPETVAKQLKALANALAAEFPGTNQAPVQAVTTAQAPTAPNTAKKYKVDGRWPDGGPRVKCVSCKDPKKPQYDANLALRRKHEEKWGAFFDMEGFTEDVFWCWQPTPAGVECGNHVLYSVANAEAG